MDTSTRSCVHPISTDLWELLEYIAKFKVDIAIKAKARDKIHDKRTYEEKLRDQLRSCVAEWFVHNSTFQPWNANKVWLDWGPDVPEDIDTAKHVNNLLCGPDVGEDIEVRSVISRDKGLIIRPRDRDKNHRAVLVYCDMDNRTAEILGWEYLQVAKSKATLKTNQWGEYWECPVNLLRQDSSSFESHSTSYPCP